MKEEIKCPKCNSVSHRLNFETNTRCECSLCLYQFDVPIPHQEVRDEGKCECHCQYCFQGNHCRNTKCGKLTSLDHKPTHSFSKSTQNEAINETLTLHSKSDDVINDYIEPYVQKRVSEAIAQGVRDIWKILELDHPDTDLGSYGWIVNVFKAYASTHNISLNTELQK